MATVPVYCSSSAQLKPGAQTCQEMTLICFGGCPCVTESKHTDALCQRDPEGTRDDVHLQCVLASRWKRRSFQPCSAMPCRTGCGEGCVPHSKQCEAYFFNLVKIQRLKFGCKTQASLSTTAEWTKLLNPGPWKSLWIFTPWDSEAAHSIFLGIPVWLSWKIMWIS